jgi:hypothetical protein
MKRFVLALALAGCASVPKTAIVDGKEVPRLTLELTGQPYTVTHTGAHPRPGGPSSGLRDSGGSIRGRVCGMFVDFDVVHKGDHVQLIGSIDSRLPAAIDVSDENGVRHFSGNLGSLGVDFTLEPTQMQGHVGIRVFALEPAGDALRGFLRIPGLLGKQRVPIVVEGLEELQKMPPADQALLLPAIMTCGGIQYTKVDAVHVGFGGEATDRPPETSAVYTKM